MHTVVCIHLYPTSLPGGTEKNRWEYIGGRALVSGCPEHWTINHQIRAKVHRPYNHNARPSQTDRRTDEHPDNSATIRSYAKMVGVLLQTVQIRLP